MMYTELSINDKSLTDKEAIEYLFAAVKYNLKGVSASLYFLPRLKEIIPEGMVLASPVNYPDGGGDFQLTQHGILAAIRKGANAIDLVLNQHYVKNNRLDSILNEVAAYVNICKDYNATLRIMMEYRMVDSKEFMRIVDILVDMDIEYILPSTGLFADDINDNLTMCNLINKKYPFLNVICTAQLWRKSQYDMIRDSGVFGMRLYKPGILWELGV